MGERERDVAIWRIVRDLAICRHKLAEMDSGRGHRGSPPEFTEEYARVRQLADECAAQLRVLGLEKLTCDDAVAKVFTVAGSEIEQAFVRLSTQEQVLAAAGCPPSSGL